MDFMTIHCGINKSVTKTFKETGRLMNIVSRGGSLLFGWMEVTGNENPFYEYFDELLEICHEYDVTISLGDSCRPGCLYDSNDATETAEMIELGKLCKRAWAAGVQVMVVRKHAQAAGDMGLPRHCIADGACLEQTELANAGLVGTQLVHQLALGNQELGSRQCGIVRLLDRNAEGLGDMDTRAMDMNVSLARARQQRTGAARQRTGRQIGPHVEAKDAIGPVALEHAALAYRLSATGRLLGRLKHKEHVTFDDARLLTNRTVDKSRRRERHGHMAIVAASVHLAGMRRSEIHTRRLRDGQGVHVGTNRRGVRSAHTGIEEGADAARTRMGHLAGKRIEHTLDIGDSLLKIEVELRNAMEVATITTEFLELGHKGSFHGCTSVAIYCAARLPHTCFQHIPAFFKRYIRILLFGKVQRGRVVTT